MTRTRALPALLLLSSLIAAASCGARVVARPPLLPMTAAWKTLLGEFVTSPLATDGRRLFAATRDGSVRALEPATGEVTWKAEGLPGRLSAAEGTLLVRAEDGTLSSLQPRSGNVRWQLKTEVTGVLPAVIDGDRALVAGHGIAAVELASGRLLWREAGGSEATAAPVAAGARLLVGEADGTLRSRDRASGASVWTLRTGSALLAPPLVDLARGQAYLGTTDKRILSVRLADGQPGWRWVVGADVAYPGLLLGDKVLFATYDAVLYALRPGGNLGWRGSLPSRPLSPPLLVSGHVVVACLENELVAFAPETGARAGSLRTTAEIRTPPALAGPVLAVGLRDRSIIGYTLSAKPPEPPSTAAPTTEKPPAAPTAPVGPREPGRLD